MFIVTIDKNVLVNPWNHVHVWHSLMDAIRYLQKYYPTVECKRVQILELGI